MTAADPAPAPVPAEPAADLHARVAVSNSAAVVDAEHESFLALIRSLVHGEEAEERSEGPVVPTSGTVGATGVGGTGGTVGATGAATAGPRATVGRIVGLVAVTFTGYAVLAQLTFLVQPVAVASFFPAAGLTLAVLLLTRPRRWPLVVTAVVAAEVMTDLMHGLPVPATSLFTLANAVEPVIAAALIRWLSRDGIRLRTVADLSLWA